MKGSIAQTGVGSSQWIRLDSDNNPFMLGFGVEVSGTVTYTVQHTFDDPLAAGVTPVAYNHPFVVAQTVQADGNIAFPVRAIRVTVTSGSGTATLKYVQATEG